MTIQQSLPAGLEDQGLEVYAHNENLICVFRGSKIDFWKLPEWIIEKFRQDMYDKNVINFYVSVGITDENKILYQHVWCNYGGFNMEADFDGQNLKPEYWDCGKRGACKLEGKTCIRISLEEKNLTRQELEITKLIRTGLADKQIADVLKISINTATTHRQRIEKKIGASCKVDVAMFAASNNLPSSYYVVANTPVG